MTSLELTITAIDDGLRTIRTLRLARHDGAPLPSFTPGSHLILQCGEVANAYSLTGECVSPAEYVVSVLDCPDGAGGSSWVHRELAVGDVVVAAPPRSAFAPVLRARRHLFVAAGIGITPVVSHLRSARRWGRETQLLYIHRDGRGAYVDETKALADDASILTDRSTFRAELETALATQPFGTHLYVCGPTAFMDQVTTLAIELGWPTSRIHVERFGIDTLDAGDPFEVHLTDSGDTFTIESGVSLLAALEARGHAVPNMCRQGVCGECRITVCGGEILHRDLYLTEADKETGDSLMSCVSRAAGDRLELAL